MSEEEYEYDSESSCDTPIPQDYVWQEIYKRIKVKNKEIYIELFENDDSSVLYTLLSTISEGITWQELVWKRQIESIHNIILRHASKRSGFGRLKELRDVETLLSNYNEPRLYLSEIVFVKLMRSLDIKDLMYLNVMCPNIKRLCLVQSVPAIFENMFYRLTYLECMGPNIKKLPRNLTEIYINGGQHFSGVVNNASILNVYLKDCQIFDWEFEYLFKRNLVTENTMVKCGCLKTIPASEFVAKLEKKLSTFHIPPFKVSNRTIPIS